MDFTFTKKLVMTSAVALSLLIGSNTAQAQLASPPEISASFATAAALTAAAGNDIDFGTWVVELDGIENPTITVVPNLAGAPTVNLLGATNSTVVNTVASANAGSVTVTTPTGTPSRVIDMSFTLDSDFDETDLSLGSLTYVTATETVASAIPATLTGSDDVTVAVGGTPETVGIGGTLTLGGGDDVLAASTTFGGSGDVVIILDFAY